MLPKMVNLNGNIYNTVGMVKLNNSAFLFATNANELASFDFTQFPELSSLPQFQVKKPTSVELVFIDFIKNALQDKMNNGQIANFDDLKKALSSVNRFVNTHQELLTNMAELDGKDQMVKAVKENLLAYFEDEMSNNEYFQKPVVNQPVVEQPQVVMQQDLPNNDLITEPIVFSEPTFMMSETQQPIVESTKPDFNFEMPVVEPQKPDFSFEVPTAQPEFNFGVPAVEAVPMMDDNNFNATAVETRPMLPEYDKDTVDLVLQSPVDPNFDVTSFVNTYYDHFTMDQINMLLSGKFALNEQQETILKQRKGTIQIYNSLEAAEAQKEAPVATVQQDKRKRFIRKEKHNQAAFVDTLLLSFTVGTICGVYLMYFVLTIMS